MVILGLTGSIGMGKSTTAVLFSQLGVRVHDSDAAVHAYYSGRGAEVIEEAFPGVTSNGRVDRGRLSARVVGNPAEMRRLEGIMHPIVGAARSEFLRDARARGDRIVVLDIPLLFEIGGETEVDAVVAVTAPADVQRARVMARPGMTTAKFEAILAKQVPDAEKRRRAHFLVHTDRGMDTAKRQVEAILRTMIHA